MNAWLMARQARRDEDRGFALIFTIFVTTMVLLAVAGTLTITTTSIARAGTSQNTSAALLAAESGIQDAIAYLTSVPACRSETRICPQALGANSTTVKPARPVLGGNQSFVWQTNSSTTTDGYVRVTSTGTAANVKKVLVADLSLNPSILRYGYYTNYESQTPTFINAYDGPRTIDITNSTDYGAISSANRGSTSSPNTVTWSGAGSSPSGYSDSVCAQHWYAAGAGSPGRAAAVAAQQKIANNPSTTQTLWAETGALAGSKTSATHYGTCDLVFTTGMVENGMTYSRDAYDIANASGSGPVFNQPVYTGWGYGSNTTPAVPSSPWRQFDGTGNDTLAGSPNKPTVATQDITLPTTIGTDGIETDSCVYYGPTRVMLNGDGTATVTSPETTSAAVQAAVAAGAASACYPSTAPQGIVNYTYNYNSTGSGTIYVKNLNTPNNGVWPTTTLKSTTTPSASNTVFWIPDTTSTVTADPSSSTAPSTCSTTNYYSGSSANTTCDWTDLPDSSKTIASQGWTAYNSGTACNKVTSAADEENFQCEWNHLASNSTSAPSSDGYASVRSTVQSGLAGGTCVNGTISAQQSCITNTLNTSVLTTADTNTTYNATSPANGAHQYYASWISNGSASNATANLTPTPGDSVFSFTGTPGAEKSTSTPMNFTVYRQTYSSSTKKWSAGLAQFTFTVVHTDWAVTSQPNGYDYFPNVQDITPYAMGSTATGTAAGTTGLDQPGDLYVQGTNQGVLSLVAQNNVELTGNITKGSGNDSSAANPVSITAGNDIRNYHPVSCTDQTAGDINATSPGWCPNDITGLTSSGVSDGSGNFYSWAPQAQYANLTAIGNRTVDAALFTLTGSLRTDNYDRAPFVGNLIVNGGIYQSYRGGNGTQSTNGSGTARTGTSLNYNYVDLERANLQYVPSASYSTNPRVWNVVSVSDGS